MELIFKILSVIMSLIGVLITLLGIAKIVFNGLMEAEGEKITGKILAFIKIFFEGDAIAFFTAGLLLIGIGILGFTGHLTSFGS